MELLELPAPHQSGVVSVTVGRSEAEEGKGLDNSSGAAPLSYELRVLNIHFGHKLRECAPSRHQEPVVLLLRQIVAAFHPHGRWFR